FCMGRDPLPIHWDVTAESDGQGMRQGPASPCVFDVPRTQWHRGCHHLCHGECLEGPRHATAQVEHLRQKGRTHGEFPALCDAMHTRDGFHKAPQHLEDTLLDMGGGSTLLEQAYKVRIGLMGQELCGLWERARQRR